jgi:hypothetical protein
VVPPPTVVRRGAGLRSPGPAPRHLPSRRTIARRISMKRSIPSRRQVSPYSPPNRTCGFPRIRLSMPARGAVQGWASDMSEAVERIPEAAHARAMSGLSGRIPSVRFRNKLGRIAAGLPFGKEPQAHCALGPLPPFTRCAEVIAASDHRPRRISVLLPQPAPNALPYPEVELVERATGSNSASPAGPG